LLVSATNASQKNGELYTLPQRLQILAGLQIAQGRFAEADRTFDRAAAFVDASIGNDSAVLDKTAWIKSVSDLYVAHFSLVAERLNNPAKAYAIVEQVRGRVMTDLLLGGSTAPLKARENEKAISRLRLRMMEATSTEEVEKIRNQMFLLEQTRWVTPEVSILKARGLAHVPLAQVQQSLNSDATILEYVLAEPSSWCLVIRKNGTGIVRLGGKSRIDTVVSAYLRDVKAKLPAQSGSRELYDALIAPVPRAEKASNIMIVRDGLLNLLPFDAVREPGGRYLAERSVASYLPSAGSFSLLAQQGRRSAPGTKVFAMGAISYEQEAKRFQSLIATNGFSPTAIPT
jgi:CHAT domain-containing protein